MSTYQAPDSVLKAYNTFSNLILIITSVVEAIIPILEKENLAYLERLSNLPQVMQILEQKFNNNLGWLRADS